MSDGINCPKCGTAIKSGAGFGMVACSECGEFVMLSGEAPIPAPPPPAPEFVNAAEVLPPIPHEFIDPIKNVEAESSLSGTIADFAVTPPQVSQAPAAAGFRDVVDFGNQTQPSLGFGALVYDIEISGIDTLEIRDEFSDCLRDKRLGLDVDKVLSQVKNGELKLNEMNPVKASALLGRVRHLPFRIRWTSRQLVKSVFMAVILALGLSAIFTAAPARASDWARHEVNLKGYASRIRNMQEDIQNLIVKKNNVKDPEQRDEFLKEIIKKNEELKKIYTDYKNEKEHIRFEHPEQGDKTERKYRHVRLKSLEELENEMGIDGQLSRLKHKVSETYPDAHPSPGPTP